MFIPLVQKISPTIFSPTKPRSHVLHLKLQITGGALKSTLQVTEPSKKFILMSIVVSEKHSFLFIFLVHMHFGEPLLCIVCLPHEVFSVQQSHCLYGLAGYVCPTRPFPAIIIHLLWFCEPQFVHHWFGIQLQQNQSQ